MTDVRSTGDVTSEILALEASLDAAREAGDVAVFDRVLAPEFRTTSPVGAVTHREEAIRGFSGGPMRIVSSTSRDIEVRTVGDGVAVVTGVARLSARVGRLGIDGDFPYTHVYVRKGVGWQVVAAHTSRRMPEWAFLLAVQVSRLFGR